ncbi:hypothetical protein ACEU6E_02160 [Halorutilales archaeon Cl-col2-1]
MEPLESCARRDEVEEAGVRKYDGFGVSEQRELEALDTALISISITPNDVAERVNVLRTRDI